MNLESDRHGKVLLVGGGHAHLELLRLAREDREFLNDVVLISNASKTYYSGMVSAWIEGIYTEEDVFINLEILAAHYGIPFICSGVVRIDPLNKSVMLENGETVTYDIVSFDIGSKVDPHNHGVVGPPEFHLKPFTGLKALKEQLTLISDGTVLVIGSGAAALEIAMALGASKKFVQGSVILLTHASGILPSGTDTVRGRFMDRLLEMSQITVVADDITSIEPGRITTTQKELSVDAVVWATGPKADPIFVASGMATDAKGYLLVDEALKSITSPGVFGAGDCIAVDGKNLSKIGVHAVREAPILYHNIRALMNGGPLQSYQPRIPQLAIFSTGDRTAILQYGSVVLCGRLPWLLKNAIDRRYMRKHKSV